jgi:GDP-mannose 6-dehydrogenase
MIGSQQHDISTPNQSSKDFSERGVGREKGQRMNVSVFGLGYVGCITAACLAYEGHQVTGVDINPVKVEAIQEGRSPLLEKGLEGLVRATTDSGHLTATQDAVAAVAHADVCMICVGTPSNSNGGLDSEHVERVCTEIGGALAQMGGYKVIALRSTVLPGTLDTQLIPVLTQASGKQSGLEFGVAVNPEFLREGSAIEDFRRPPFTLIGQVDERAGDALAALYADIPAPIFRTDPDTACMVKYASNAFHALKVTFANEIGRLCKELGIDSTKVMDIFCEDSKLNISSRYLRPGYAFGGSCLPKDLRALLYLARHSDVALPVLESILPSNCMQVEKAVELIVKDHRRKVGIIGLSFKPHTDDLRESPIVQLVETLIGKGLEVRIYDENVNLSKLLGGNKAFIESIIPHISALMCATLEEVLTDSEVIVVAHRQRDGWKRLSGLLRPDQLLIDLVKAMPDGDRCPAAYEGISW